MLTAGTILWEFSKKFASSNGFILLLTCILSILLVLFLIFIIIFLLYRGFFHYFKLKYKPRDFILNKTPYILGHRGIPVLQHENSIESFKLLSTYDIDGTELDANVSADGKLFVYHDYSLFRFFDIPKNIRKVSSQTIESLKISLFFENNSLTPTSIKINQAKKNEEKDFMTEESLDKGNIDKIVKLSETTIPTLEAAFEVLKDRRFINLEIKSNSLFSIGLEQKVAHLIKQYKLENKIVVSSFDPFCLYRFSKILPLIPRGLLVSKKGLPIYLKKMWFYPFAKADFIHWEADFIGTKKVKKFAEHGYKPVFWGVNSVQLLKRALKDKPVIIISDIPHILKKALPFFI
ncbi:MAG TPA: glycerophosphodiester phosphodiesterase family protein [Exilispira sp.]|nr:glycerophosphodiester phosphodiesterase family protein [Exilispira sp.]